MTRLVLRFPIRLAPLPALALLAACGEDAAQPQQVEGDERTASGEVLEGSISDAMLPVETLQSQPPLLRVVERPADGGGEADPANAGAGEADDAAEAGEPATPAAEPAEAAEPPASTE